MILKIRNKAQSPGREGPSAGKSYPDYQKISIDKHDKVTKKNKKCWFGRQRRTRYI